VKKRIPIDTETSQLKNRKTSKVRVLGSFPSDFLDHISVFSLYSIFHTENKNYYNFLRTALKLFITYFVIYFVAGTSSAN
jgi:hypothetical protein